MVKSPMMNGPIQGAATIPRINPMNREPVYPVCDLEMTGLKKAGIRNSQNPKKLRAMRKSTDDTKMRTAGCCRIEPINLPVSAEVTPRVEFMKEIPRI